RDAGRLRGGVMPTDQDGRAGPDARRERGDEHVDQQPPGAARTPRFFRPAARARAAGRITWPGRAGGVPARPRLAAVPALVPVSALVAVSALVSVRALVTVRALVAV